ncbi:hypothetical protein PTTG_06110 [Puccinia triticina 1-1 BBBD Race 1]|uniref:Uncharacterized protein n=1 Tax=Puccinia triticina (isolate 1-1 / race 1 (BBBD)) TaxID=630390 RepID=A0A180G9S2_PUCT1|nr:hypothetical protein PTTG_06110 [Puccinia triticina 1-1 BBBD Race 1]
MFNLIAETTSAVKQAAGVGSSTARSQGAERPTKGGQDQGQQARQEEHPDELTVQSVVAQGEPQTMPPKKPKKVTIAKAVTRKIATRSSSKAPGGGR